MRFSKFTIMLVVTGVAQCVAMSFSELEDFSNFLKKTSQLDENVKTVEPEDESEEAVSDHAWEESGKFEGDLILNEKQRRLIVENVAEGLSRNGLKDSTKRWPDNELIYYIQREHFSADQVDAIQSGIDDLARASCVKFRPYRKGDRDAVVIQGARRGCFSQVGYQGGFQVLNLSQRHPVGRGCFRHGTVIHELLHSLGFYHMQSSPDRDDYIDVLWENILEPARHNFRKYNTFSVSDFGVGYDYESVLHYSRRAFSANGQDTLIPKKSGAQIGQRIGLSQKDSEKLNRMYCDVSSDDPENTTKRTKKKKPKNLPFEGHGIGYHQGKTVVIKLPDAKPYKVQEIPTYQVFDYFSKAPETLSTEKIEKFGDGKKVVFTYEYPQLPSSVTSQDDIKVSTVLNVPENMDRNKKDHLINEQSNSSINGNNINKPSTSLTTYSYPHGEGLDEEFNRLGKILKNHVYPSQTPDLSVYKKNTDYSELNNPKVEFKTKLESINDDKWVLSSLPREHTKKEKYNESNISKNQIRQYFNEMDYEMDHTHANEEQRNDHNALKFGDQDINLHKDDFSTNTDSDDYVPKIINRLKYGGLEIVTEIPSYENLSKSYHDDYDALKSPVQYRDETKFSESQSLPNEYLSQLKLFQQDYHENLRRPLIRNNDFYPFTVGYK